MQSKATLPAPAWESHAAHTQSELAIPVGRAILATREWLLDQQLPDGHWCAELEGDGILESETILLWAFLGEEHSELARRAAQRLVQTQLPGGGWAMYPGGAVEISGSVKAYFALKLTGHDPSAEFMARARRAILAHGGADAVNSFTRFYLALLGQIPYAQCPAVPPEAVLLPRWFPVNLYAISSWSRTIVVPLSIISALQPVRQLPVEQGIRELFLRAPADWPPLRCPGRNDGTGLLSWDRFFRTLDRALQWLQQNRLMPLRRHALLAAERWMRARFQNSDGLGAIYPPIVWSHIALVALGYADASPEVQYCRRQLQDLILEEAPDGPIRVQPCKSPVWDTALTIRALDAAGTPPDAPALRRAARWLLEKQILRPGDWSHNVSAAAGGWCFEYANDFYPDCDDTAMALMALQTRFAGPAAAADALDDTALAIHRGLNWLLAMQNDDGGWGAFDHNNTREFLCHVPFADHNAMIDPSTPDLAARVLEALGRLGRRQGDAAVDRAVRYLRGTQEPDGSWYGRWGVNYIYGTWQALTGLAAVGVPPDDAALAAGAHWLAVHQQPDGAWGESPDSYADRTRRGQGPATPSQTAWAVLGLLAAGRGTDASVRRGVAWLVAHQLPDGTWEETPFTGTGFPQVFYLRYHYYRVYFPLLALAEFARVAP